jgi:hypothetical protein
MPAYIFLINIYSSLAEILLNTKPRETKDNLYLQSGLWDMYSAIIYSIKPYEYQGMKTGRKSTL